MKEIVHGIGGAVAVVAWLSGAVLAPGWLKVAAFFFPPYPLYLLTERVMQAMGWVQ